MTRKKLLMALFAPVIFSSCAVLVTQKTPVTHNDTLQYMNWHNRDLKMDKIPGTSVELAFKELLKDKTPSKVIVAVIDGGIDINHKGLQGKIWKNADVPNNGIDDDHNGFVDDTCGWNFLGNAKGSLIDFETLEVTRIYKKYCKKYELVTSAQSLSSSEKKEYDLYKKVCLEYNSNYKESKETYDAINELDEKYREKDKIVKIYLGRDTYTIKDLKEIQTYDNRLKNAVHFLIQLKKKGFTESDLNEYKKHFEEKVKYQYNPDYDIRAEVIGDDPEMNLAPGYGNNNVNHCSGHGTFVAGVIVNMHKYSQSIWGVADSVQIMPVVAVPSGDERDKDIANAIRYAVDNGARVINMSFGKAYSPQKQLVDEAVKYAERKNVLLIHAAGNESLNVDTLEHYPSPVMLDGTNVGNFITVGATGNKDNKYLMGDFSNYGKKTVDLFAPGVNIYSFKPGNKYDISSGTSFSSPVVAGVASLVLSYYPELTAVQVREILIKSVVRFEKRKVYKDSTRKEYVYFKDLSSTGGIVNAYKALQLAEEYSKKKN